MESESSVASQRAKVLEAMLEQLKHPEDAAGAVAVSYLASRASATTHDFATVLNWIYPDSRDLIEFEENRFNNLSNLGKPSAWNGIIERTWSEATILDSTATRTEVRLTIQDWTKIQWRPTPVSIRRTVEQEALVRKYPEKFGIEAFDFPVIHSGFATKHEICLVRTAKGWLVFQDDYEEPILTLGKISGIQTSLATISYLKTELTLDQFHRIALPGDGLETEGGQFDWREASNYAALHAVMGNSKYSAFLPNDSANFVSQSLAAGGHSMSSTWSPYTPAWINSRELKNWILASERGLPTDEGALGMGDIINYSYHSNGVYEGVAVVTGLPGPLISCHSSGHLNIPYKAIAAPGTSFTYTTLLSFY